MSKKAAVIVRGRSEEALRMALGLTLLNDVDVYLFSGPPADTEMNRMNIDMLKEVKAGLYSLCPVQDFAQVDAQALPEKLLEYETVIAY